MRPSIAWMVVVAGVALASIGMGSCGAFGEAPASAGGGGEGGSDTGAPIEPPRARDVRLQIDWPQLAALDPAKDPRALKMRVVIEDAADPSRRVERSIAAVELGPFDFAGFVTTNRVDAVVEIFGGDDRLLGYGQRRGWDLASSTAVPVAARKRILYFASRDRGEPVGELRALDLAPDTVGEPGIDESLAKLDTLALGTALHVTTDGVLLVEAGRTAPTGPGAIAVFETGTHLRSKTIPLPFVPSAVAPLGDGRLLVAFPGDQSNSSTFARVDISTGVVEPVPAGFQGGTIVVTSATSSPDGARAVAVGSYDSGGSARPKPYLFLYDPSVGTAGKTSAIELNGVGAASGVRFSPDGARLIVIGYTDAVGVDEATGAVLVFDGASPTVATKTFPLAKRLRPSSLAVHPDGRHAYVSSAQQYPAAGGCCADMLILDLETGVEVLRYPMTTTAPEYDLASVVRLPYPPYRVLAGQSDPANDLRSPVVEITMPAERPTDVDVKAMGIGSFDAMVSPFARSL